MQTAFECEVFDLLSYLRLIGISIHLQNHRRVGAGG